MNCCTKVVLFLITTKKYNGFFPFLSQIRQIGSIHEGVHYLQSATCFLFGRPFTGKTWLLYPLFTPH